MKLHLAICSFFIAGMAHFSPVHLACGDVFSPEPGVRQLFLDDVGIEKAIGLRRTIHPPKRHPQNPVIKPDMPWEDRCQVYGTALWDSDAGVFKIWYLTVPRDRGLKPLDLGDGHIRSPQTTLAAYAFSRDGIHWAKPVLDQFPYDGDKRNNLLNLGVNNCEGISVLHEPRDANPDRRWKCLYWDHGSGGYELRDGKPYCKDGPDDGLCVAFSRDGLTWKPIPENPVIHKYSDTGQSLLYDPRLARWVAYGRFGFGRRIARAAVQTAFIGPSPNLSWNAMPRTDPIRSFMVRESTCMRASTSPCCGCIAKAAMARSIHSLQPAVTVCIGRALPIARPGYRSVTKRVGKGAWSAALAASFHGATSCLSITAASTVLTDCAGHPPVVRQHRPAIGLLMQRRDGFVSLDASDQPCTLVTKPFVVPAGRLVLNVEAQSGEVTAALCDAEEQPLDGFEQSEPIRTEGVTIPVVFKGAVLKSLIGKTVRLKVTARNARLYAYAFEK